MAQQIAGNADTYEIPENGLLGQGQFGKVKRCVAETTGTRYAVKMIKKANIKTAKDVATVKKEVSFMKTLNGHPNILCMVDMAEDTEKLYLVLELAEGGDLFDKIVEVGGFNEEGARHFFRQIIGGLEFCHGKGIVHRDLKPENLLLGDQEVLKISDFGLSNVILSPQQMLATHCGSEKYAAPEVMQTTDPYYGPPVDIWSCGVILYIMVGGAFPFVQADHKCELYISLEQGHFKYPEHFSADLKDLLSKMFAIKPEERITIEQIKQHRWFDPEAAEAAKYRSVSEDMMAVDEEGLVSAAMDDEPIYRSLEPGMMDAMSCDAGFEEEPVYRSIDVKLEGAAPPATGESPSESPKSSCTGFGVKASCDFTSPKPVKEVYATVTKLLEANGAAVDTSRQAAGLVIATCMGASGKEVVVNVRIEADASEMTHIAVKRIQGHGLDYCGIFKKIKPLFKDECCA